MKRPVLLSAFGLMASAMAQDAERATHGDLASQPQVAFEHRGGELLLRQYQLGCLSHLSYLLVARSTGEAALVDPQRDVEHYLADIEREGARLRYVLLTHPHADFVAGHTELRQRTGAEVLISAEAGARFPHRPLADRDRVALGGASIETWATPGHTPNAMTFLVHEPGAEVDPAFALTGDTLFIGGIGRPDLLDVPPAQLAAQSFASVQRLKTLPDATLVLPAHGAGSLCGAHLSPETTSTIGEQKRSNPYLRIASEASFIASVISHQPVAPPYFRFNVEMNLQGPPLVERGAIPPQLTAAQAKAALDTGAWAIDLRDQRSYAAGHVPGAVNVALRGRLDTWTGTVVPFGADVVLVGSEDDVCEGAFRLARIGYDTVTGWLAPDPAGWREAGLGIRSSRLIAPRELYAAMRDGSEPLVVDVRTADEFDDLRLGDVGNIPVTDFAHLGESLDPAHPVLMVCNSAYRSSMAVGLAERLGFTDVASLDGGLDAWLDAGLPVVGRAATPAPSPAAGGAIALPEPIDAALLARVLMDQPQSYAVIDLRPAWQHEEWSIPGAANVAIDDVAAHVAALPEATRVVLVDRDGTTAFAVAGALMARAPARLIRALVGGVRDYYRTIELHRGGTDAAMPPPGTAPAATAPAPTPATPAPRRRKAGC